MSNVRRQLESWLKKIDVKGSVLDVGGFAMPVKGRTKSWDVSDYRILDIRGGDIKEDLNEYIIRPPTRDGGLEPDFDIVFCLEVMEYIYNPFQALENINQYLNEFGTLYISTHFMFPHHSGGPDSLRYTSIGITRLLEKTGFEDIKITPRYALNPLTMEIWQKEESKVCKYPTEIGHMIKAIKI